MNKKQILREGVYGTEELDMEEKLTKASQWGIVGPKSFKSFPSTHKVLPAGCYEISRDNNDGRPIFIGKTIKIDSILRFKDDLIDKILNEISDFWGKRDVFIDNGFLHRRGYMLYGPAGTGKSSIVWLITQDVIKNGGIVFVCDNPRFFALALRTFREAEPNRPVVCVFEDIDAIIKEYGDKDVLSLLDGENQIDRVLNIATTNYPELLDGRIINRPRRFDRLYKILPPSDQTRIAFLKSKLPKKQNLDTWIKKTKGLSFASLSEVIISVICLGNKLDDVVKIIKEMESKHPSSSEFGKENKIGFDSSTGAASPSSENQISDAHDY